MKQLWTGLACLGLILAPAMQAQAEKMQSKTAKIPNVSLTNSGSLHGKAVNGQGEALNGAKVTVSRNRQVVATAITTADGEFEVNGLSTGIYEVQAGQGKGTVRAWDAQVAPPASRKNVLIVSGADAARAQSGLFVDPLDTITLGLSITGVALGAAALSEDNETIIVSP